MLRALDLSLLRLLRTRAHPPPVERAVIEVARTGEHGIVWHLIALGGAVLDRPRRPEYLRAARVVAAATVVNTLVKALFRRRRPELEDLPPMVSTMSSRSYPSAHAATSYAGARALSELLPAPPLYALAAVLALSRPYLGVHYPSDVVAGAVLGDAVAKLVP